MYILIIRTWQCACTVCVHRQVCTLQRYVCVLCRQLCRWCNEEKEVSPQGLVLAWQRESWWTYSGIMSSEVDRERYWEVVCHALRKHFSESNMVSSICIYHSPSHHLHLLAS